MRWIAVTLCLGMLAVACAGEEDDDGAPVACLEPSFTSIYTGRLSKPEFCAGSGCHDASSSGGQNYAAGKDAAHAVLLSNTVHPVGRDMWPKRVVPNAPDQSFLYAKLSLADPPGDRMPLSRPMLQQCDLDAIRLWIANGAAND